MINQVVGTPIYMGKTLLQFTVTSYSVHKYFLENCLIFRNSFYSNT